MPPKMTTTKSGTVETTVETGAESAMPPDLHPVRESATETPSPPLAPVEDPEPGKRALNAKLKRRAERAAADIDEAKAVPRLVRITDRVRPTMANRVTLVDHSGYPNVFVRGGDKPILERRMSIPPAIERQLVTEGYEVTAVPATEPAS